MLLALGFLLATLLSLLLAPVVWRRAARLATRKLKASLPVSLTDFHAEKDQLRADYAIQIRNLEVNLEQAREKTARQMVEIGRQRAENMTLANQIRELRSALSERKSLISVMEQTLNANVPRMKERMEAELGAKIALSDKVANLEGALKKTTHQLEEADRNMKMREAEIQKLRQAVNVKTRGESLFSLARRHQKDGIGKTVAAKTKMDLADLGLVEGEKGAAALQSLQQENEQLREIIAQTKEQLARVKSFEEKEVPLLRQEMRQLGAEVLRSAQVPKRDKEADRVPLAGMNISSHGSSIRETGKIKRSLADRLKSVTKLGGQVDA